MREMGKVYDIILKSGENAKGKWESMDLIAEFPDGQGFKKIVFSLFGHLYETAKNYKKGDEISVEYWVGAREYNGKLYNNVYLTNIQLGVGAMSVKFIDKYMKANEGLRQTAEEIEGDLPFD